MNVVLIVAGLALALGAGWRIRPPLRRLRELRATAANLARYDDWRGGRRGGPSGDVTGAEVMERILRRQVTILGVLLAVGIVLVLAGLLAR